MAPSTRWAVAAVGVVLAGIALVVGGPHVLRHLVFFRIRTIQIAGARYSDPLQIATRLHVDSTASVWDDLHPYEVRAREVSELSAVTVRRKLPNTVVVEVTEREPVALVPDGAATATNEGGAGGNVSGGAALVAYDASGAALPIDVTRVDVDAPVLRRADLSALRLLGALEREEPSVYAQVSEVKRGSSGDFILTMPSYTVRAAADIDVVRFAELDPVMADLARRHITPMEIDLRFRDQVVVRR